MKQKTLTKNQAKAMLKARGLTIKSLAEHLEIQPRAITSRWQSGELSIRDTLMVYGYVAVHDYDLQCLAQHRDDAVIQARLEQLTSRQTVTIQQPALHTSPG